MINEKIKSIVDSQFIKWIGNKHIEKIEDIAFAVKPVDYKYIPDYKIILTAKYEKRDFVFNKIKPFSGERIPKTVAPLREIWDYKIETSDVMQKSEDSFVIKESFEKETCPACDGDPYSDCPKCDGDGTANCENCNGYGELICGRCDGDKKIWCPRCNGTGKRLVYENGKERKRNCQYCNGAEKVLCPDCDGKGTVICRKCNGEKTFECDECNGEGKICCSTCQGSSNILKYTEIKRESDILKKTGTFFNSETTDKLKKSLKRIRIM